MFESFLDTPKATEAALIIKDDFWNEVPVKRGALIPHYTEGKTNIKPVRIKFNPKNSFEIDALILVP